MPAILLFSIQDILENAPSELIKVYLDLTYLLRLVIRAWEQALEQRTILQTQMNCRVFTSLVQWTWTTSNPTGHTAAKQSYSTNHDQRRVLVGSQKPMSTWIGSLIGHEPD